MIEVEIFPPLRLYFSLEGGAWTAGGHANILQQNRNAVKSVTP